MKKGIYLMDRENFDKVYPPHIRTRIAKRLDMAGICIDRQGLHSHPDLLENAQVVFSSWGAPVFDAELLRAMPALEIVFYAAGSVKHFVTDAFFKRGILLSSAWAANAVPVAEYAFAQIILALKGYWGYLRNASPYPRLSCPGGYRSRVGIISLGMIGKKVCERLLTLDTLNLAFDPCLDELTARQYGVIPSSLHEIFSLCDVISLHAPLLDSTRGMIGKEHFLLMKQGGVFINTARGGLVDEKGMMEALRQRRDLTALLDVTDPEPPEKGSPLYDMENVFLTPHIAGSLDGECARMGEYMLEECFGYLDGKPLQYAVTKESLETSA
ncbi:MAG: hydroxyacid dehydrogenase [Clostridia bacterium]